MLFFHRGNEHLSPGKRASYTTAFFVSRVGRPRMGQTAAVNAKRPTAPTLLVSGRALVERTSCWLSVKILKIEDL